MQNIRQHVDVLGILYIVFGAMTALSGLIVFTVVVGGGLIGGLASREEEVIVITSIVGVVLGAFLVVMGLPGIVAGAFLLKGRNWARVVTLVLGILNLMNFPLGTALGIYTLWVLLSAEAQAHFGGSSYGTAPVSVPVSGPVGPTGGGA